MTIEYHYENEFRVNDEAKYSEWINRIINSEDSNIGPINYIFCDDAYLLNINQMYLKHDTLTDVITFDYSEGGSIIGDIFISIERVEENAKDFNVGFEEELRRVMVHGVLHLVGYNDKNSEDKEIMRAKENEKIKLFHVEQ